MTDHAHWISDTFSGVPVQRAALGEADLSVMRIGPRWSWLVRRDGAEVAEGAADNLAAAQQAAEAAAEP
jgi:hypothetical protein